MSFAKMKILWVSTGADYFFRSKQYYQQLLLFSKRHDVTLIVRKSARVSDEIKEVVASIHYIPEYLTPMFSLYIYLKSLLNKKYDVIYTKLNFSIISGVILKLFFKSNIIWVANLNDHPMAVLVYSKWSFRYVKFKTFIILLKQVKILSLVDIGITTGTEMSKGLPKVLTSEYHVPPDKILLVENGTDLGLFKRTKENIPERPFKMVFVGHLSTYFGIDILLKAIFLMKDECSDFQLVLIGIASKEEIEYFENKFTEYDIKDNVIYKGVIKSENLPSELQECHVGIYPFKDRPYLDTVLPVKVYEYLAMELPVVGSKLYGVSQIVKHGYNGFLVDPDNPEDLAKALIILYKNKELYDSLKTNTRNSVLENNWKDIVESIALKLEDEVRKKRI